MSDIGIGPLNITRPERVGTMTVIVRLKGGEGAYGTAADTRNLTDPTLSAIEGKLRETSLEKANLDPIAWSEDTAVYVNTKKRRLTQGQVDRVVSAISDAIDEAYPGVTDASPPTIGTVSIRSEYPIGGA